MLISEAACGARQHDWAAVGWTRCANHCSELQAYTADSCQSKRHSTGMILLSRRGHAAAAMHRTGMQAAMEWRTGPDIK